jgi:hypothetical protein
LVDKNNNNKNKLSKKIILEKMEIKSYNKA